MGGQWLRMMVILPNDRSSREVHLQRWWSRVEHRHDQNTRELWPSLHSAASLKT
jgi:hypothetical protein